MYQKQYIPHAVFQNSIQRILRESYELLILSPKKKYSIENAELNFL